MLPAFFLPARRDEIGRDTAPHDRERDYKNLENPSPALFPRGEGLTTGQTTMRLPLPIPLTCVVPDSSEAKRAALKNPSNEGVLDGSERAGRAGRNGAVTRTPGRSRISSRQGRGEQTEDASRPGKAWLRACVCRSSS